VTRDTPVPIHRLLAILLSLTGCATPPPRPTAPQPASVVAPTMPLPPGVFRLHIESPLPVPLTEHLGIVDTHYGVAGRFEWIIDQGMVTHRMFVAGGTVNGVPIVR
jgi:hypothetical protein